MNIVFKNYKPYKGKHTFNVKPFNVILGRNNAGKSSLTDIIHEVTNIKFIDKSLNNIFALNNLSQKNKVINKGIYSFDKDFREVGSLISNIFSTEEFIADLLYGIEEYKHKDRFWLTRHFYKNLDKPLKNVDVKFLSKQLIELENLYNKLLSKKNIPFWFIAHHKKRSLDVFYNEDVFSRARDNKKKRAYIKNRIHESKIYKMAGFAVDTVQEGLGLELELDTPCPPNNFSSVIFDKSFKKYASIWDNHNEDYEFRKQKSIKSLLEDFSKTKYFKLFTKQRYNFLNEINDYLIDVYNVKGINRNFSALQSRSRRERSTLEANCSVNITDNDYTINYVSSSDNLSHLIDGAQISFSKQKQHILSNNPAKFFFKKGSYVYEKNISLVNKILNYSAQSLTKIVPVDSLEGVLHLNNCFYYDVISANSSNLPFERTSKLFPKSRYMRPSLTSDLSSNSFHKTLDNLPFNLLSSNNVSNKDSLLPKVLCVPNNEIDFESNLISRTFGLSFECNDLFFNETIMDDVDEIELNDCNVVKKMLNHPKIGHLIFPKFKIDIKLNKVAGVKGDINNVFSTSSQRRIPMRYSRFAESFRRIDDLHGLLLGKCMEIYEIGELYKKHKKNTSQSRKNLNSRELEILENIEKFLISSYLSTTACKILELLNGFIFFNYYNRGLADEKFIKNYDAFDRRIDSFSSIKSSIIDASPVVYSNIRGSAYSEDDLLKIFGLNIQNILIDQRAINNLCSKVNDHLSNIDIKYEFSIDLLRHEKMSKGRRPSVLRNKLPDAYELTLRKIYSKRKSIEESTRDFMQVGTGTRNLIAIFAQLELAKLDSGRKNLIIIREPENYLHPGLTGRVVKYLYQSIANENLNIILETHSEIIVRQLQVLIKNSKNEENHILLKDNLKIYYVDNVEDEGSNFKEIRISEDGFLEEEIPENFLGINADLTTELW